MWTTAKMTSTQKFIMVALHGLFFVILKLQKTNSSVLFLFLTFLRTWLCLLRKWTFVCGVFYFAITFIDITSLLYAFNKFVHSILANWSISLHALLLNNYPYFMPFYYPYCVWKFSTISAILYYNIGMLYNSCYVCCWKYVTNLSLLVVTLSTEMLKTSVDMAKVLYENKCK